jgi:hypothetical protein
MKFYTQEKKNLLFVNQPLFWLYLLENAVVKITNTKN